VQREVNLVHDDDDDAAADSAGMHYPYNELEQQFMTFTLGE
jgi:hypothetical protein